MKLQLTMDFDDGAEFAALAPRLAAIFADLKTAAARVFNGPAETEAAREALAEALDNDAKAAEADKPKRGRPRKADASIPAAPAAEEAAPAPVTTAAPAAAETPASAPEKPAAAPSSDAPKNHEEFRAKAPALIAVIGPPAFNALVMKHNGGSGAVTGITSKRDGETEADQQNRIAAFWAVLEGAAAEAKAAKAAEKAAKAAK